MKHLILLPIFILSRIVKAIFINSNSLPYFKWLKNEHARVKDIYIAATTIILICLKAFLSWLIFSIVLFLITIIYLCYIFASVNNAIKEAD